MTTKQSRLSKKSLLRCVLRNQLRSYLEMAHLDKEGSIVAPIADGGIAGTQNGVEVIVIDDVSDDSDIEVMNVDTMDLESEVDSESDSIMSPEIDLEV